MILRICVDQCDWNDDFTILEINRNTDLCPSREQLLKANQDDLEWWDYDSEENSWQVSYITAREFKKIFGNRPQENRVYLMFLPNFPNDKEIIDEELEVGRHDLKEILFSGNEIVDWTHPAGNLAYSIYSELLGCEEEEDDDD